MIPAHYVICETEEERARLIRRRDEDFQRKAKRSRNKARTASTRGFVMQRANQRCEICAFDFSPILTVHHILPVHLGGSARVQNLIALCPNCHGMVHHYRKAWEASQWEAWMQCIQSAGYSEKQSRKILLIASQEAVVNHNGSIVPHKRPEPTAFVLKSELTTWEINA